MAGARPSADTRAMTIFAFLCTGPNTGWDPLCNSGHFVLLILAGVATGSLLTLLVTYKASMVAKFIAWPVCVVPCTLLALWLGFTAI